MTEDIHSCSYFCTPPACVLAQRDELRDSHGAGNQVPPTAQPAQRLTDEQITLALQRAYSLGQTYWQQADSDYTSEHRKSDVTHAKFKALIAETIAATPKD